ncbi:MAG: SEC-C domain-containing protein, partial [Kiritimatiellae bacterium]|nr:SEC-C domain-containing protein [Kiritimatiellia bacterium]
EEAGDFVYGRVEEAYEMKCAGEDPETLPFMERGVFLSVIDREWQDYLRAMDDVSHGVNLRAYGQRDPLIDYKKEAFEMFEQLMSSIKTKVVSSEFRSTTAANLRRMIAAMESQRQKSVTNEDDITVDGDDSEPSRPAQAEAPKTVADVFASMMSARMAAAKPAASGANPADRQSSVGRNDPCPCGSGKKFKKCCGRNEI